MARGDRCGSGRERRIAALRLLVAEALAGGRAARRAALREPGTDRRHDSTGRGREAEGRRACRSAASTPGRATGLDLLGPGRTPREKAGASATAGSSTAGVGSAVSVGWIVDLPFATEAVAEAQRFAYVAAIFNSASAATPFSDYVRGARHSSGFRAPHTGAGQAIRGRLPKALLAAEAIIVWQRGTRLPERHIRGGRSARRLTPVIFDLVVDPITTPATHHEAAHLSVGRSRPSARAAFWGRGTRATESVQTAVDHVDHAVRREDVGCGHGRAAVERQLATDDQQLDLLTLLMVLTEPFCVATAIAWSAFTEAARAWRLCTFVSSAGSLIIYRVVGRGAAASSASRTRRRRSEDRERAGLESKHADEAGLLGTSETSVEKSGFLSAISTIALGRRRRDNRRRCMETASMT